MAARSVPPLELGFSFDVLLLNNPDVILFILFIFGEILDLLCEEQRSEYDAYYEQQVASQALLC